MEELLSPTHHTQAKRRWGAISGPFPQKTTYYHSNSAAAAPWFTGFPEREFPLSSKVPGRRQSPGSSDLTAPLPSSLRHPSLSLPWSSSQWSKPFPLASSHAGPPKPVIWSLWTCSVAFADEAHDPGLPLRMERQAWEVKYHLRHPLPYTFSFFHKVCLSTVVVWI